MPRPALRSIGLRAAAAVIALGAGSLRAERPITEVSALARPYGSGVHAYFACDFQRAYDDLTQSIEAGTRDPRAWYFRGLAALQLGRLDESEADFSLGAEKEATAVGDWNVGLSLERVQGQPRLALERHRARARVAALQLRTEAARRRYGDGQARQPEVLRGIRPEGAAGDPLDLFTGGEPVEPAVPAERIPAPPVAEPEAETEPEPEPEAEREADAGIGKETVTMPDEPAGEQPVAEEPSADDTAAAAASDETAAEAAPAELEQPAEDGAVPALGQ